MFFTLSTIHLPIQNNCIESLNIRKQKQKKKKDNDQNTE